MERPGDERLLGYAKTSPNPVALLNFEAMNGLMSQSVRQIGMKGATCARVKYERPLSFHISGVRGEHGGRRILKIAQAINRVGVR